MGTNEIACEFSGDTPEDELFSMYDITDDGEWVALIDSLFLSKPGKMDPRNIELIEARNHPKARDKSGSARFEGSRMPAEKIIEISKFKRRMF